METLNYENFDLRIERIPTPDYNLYNARVIYSPVGEVNAMCKISFFPAIGKVRWNIYHRLIDVPNPASLGFKAIVGKDLFESVFHGEVGEYLRRSLDFAKQNDL